MNVFAPPLPQVHAASSLSPPRGAEHLEAGSLLGWTEQELRLPSPEDLSFLHGAVAKGLRLKNISYHPEGAFLSGLRAPRPVRRRAAQILREHLQEVERALGAALPEYAAAWERGKVNYRPVEERGRALPRRSSNEILHVDAFASGATHGARVLRVFTNVHPGEPRVWRSAGSFQQLWERYGIGLPARTRVSPWERGATALWRGLARLAPPARLLESSPYDRTMRRFHNHLKMLPQMEAGHPEAPPQVTLELAPGHSWAVMTDGVSHAVTSGQYALVCTFHIPLRVCVAPQTSPYALLSGAGGGAP